MPKHSYRKNISHPLENAVIFDSPTESGLANQLRGLTSTILLAEETGRPFFLHWGNIKDMPGVTELGQLFENPVFNTTQISHKKLNKIQRRQYYFERRRVTNFFNQLKYLLLPHNQFNNILCDMTANNINLSLPLIMISTYYSFFPKAVNGIDFFNKRHQIYQRFSPVSDVKNRYKEFINRHFADNTIGVHIRSKKNHRGLTKQWDSGADGKMSQSSLQIFSSLIDEEIKNNPEVKIFLATDNTEVCRPIINKYQDRLLTYHKDTTEGMVNRFSIEDQKTALIDFYLLANTRKLIGTKQSTFSYEAAVLGNIPFIEVSDSGLRQEYTLVDDRRVLIDFRDNGIGDFEKKTFFNIQGKNSSGYRTPDVKEKHIIQFFYDKLKNMKKPVVIDIGAGTGRFSLVSKFIKESTFYAVEPHSLLYDVLQSNMKLNHIEKRVQTFNLGLLDACGKKAYYIPRNGRYYFSTFAKKTDHSPLFKETTAPVETLDYFVTMRNISKLDFINIDAEGAAYNILRTGKAALKRLRPAILLRKNDKKARQFGIDKNALPDLLESLGYKYKKIKSSHIFYFFGQ